MIRSFTSQADCVLRHHLQNLQAGVGVCRLRSVSGAARSREAYLDSFPLARNLQQARLASLRELHSAAGEELRPLFGRTLLPSVLRPQGGAFKGEL